MGLPHGFVLGVDVLGSALLHFLWQGALLGLCYALLRPLCAGVAARYRLGMALLLALTACPVLTLVYLWPVAGVANVTANDNLTLLAGSIDAGSIGASSIGAVADRVASGWNLEPMLPWLVGCWICGVLIIGLRSLWNWRRLSLLVRQASEPSPYWRARLAHACERFGLLRPVRLLCSASAITPMLIGWIRPVILLPASMFSGFTPQQIELIIAHELGHIRRWDYLANLIQVVIETVLFYHPVVHWISRDVRNARESCCDDIVLSVAEGNPLTYARTLADLEELRQDLNLAAPALGAAGGVLLTRIRRIVGATDEMLDPLPRSNAWPLLLAIAAIVCLTWRPHTSVSDMSAVLSTAPAQALTLVSGNPHLAASAVAAAPVAQSVAKPAAVDMLPIAQPSATNDADKSEPIAVHISRPHVNIAPSTTRLDRVGNVAAVTPVLPVVNLAESDVALPAVAKPAPLHVVAPVYPPRAMSAGIEGKVELEFGVDANGQVRDIRVVQAQPVGEFDAAAKAALAEWRFPASSSRERYTQNFAFTLHGKASEDANAKCKQQIGTLICRRPGE